MIRNLINIQVSFPSDYDCNALCKQLIQNHIAICIHKLPNIVSYYEWEKTLEQSDEYLLQIKAFDTNFKTVESTILTYHPYDIPEIISFKTNQVHQPYLDWAGGL